MKRLLLLLALAFAYLVLAPIAHAQVACGPLAEIVSQISGKKYAEKPAMSGILNSGLPLVIFGNKETGTWTALRLHPGGEACIVGIGTGFKENPAELPGVPS